MKRLQILIMFLLFSCAGSSNENSHSADENTI